MSDVAPLTLVLPPGVALPGGRAGRRLGRAAALHPGAPDGAAVAPGYGYWATLCALWRLPLAGDADVPVAALGAAAELGARPGTHWLRADPVVLVAARAELRLLADTLADLPAALAQSLCNALAQADIVPAPGARWHAPHPSRWYLSLPVAPALRTTPPAALLGAHVQDGLPQGPDGAGWRGALNAAQMVLYQAQADLAADVAPVSSVWFWGAGRVPAVPAGVFAQVWAADVAARGLGVLSGARLLDGAPPADLDAPASGPTLLAPEGAQAPAALARALAARGPARVVVTTPDAPAQVHTLAPRRPWWAVWRR